MSVKQPKVYFFYKINRFNLLPIYFFSLFYDCYFYSSELPEETLKKIRIRRLKNFSDHNEWFSIQERYQQRFSQLASSIVPPQYTLLGFNFDRYIFHKFLTEGEIAVQGILLASKQLGPDAIISSIGFPFDKKLFDTEIVKSFLDEMKVQVRFSLWSYMISFSKSLIYASYNVLRIAELVFGKKCETSSPVIIVDGFSSEFDANPTSFINVAWMKQYGIFEKDYIHYYIANKIQSKRQDLHLGPLGGLLGRWDLLVVLMTAIFYLPLLLLSSYHEVLSSSWMKIVVVQKLIQRRKIKSYVTTLSNAWPEDILPSLLSQKNISTRAWLYTNGEFNFSSKDSQFQDLNIRLCFSTFDSVLVWFKETKMHLQRRFIENVGYLPNRSHIIAACPMVNGEFEAFELTSYEARQKYLGINSSDVFIGVFDIPPMKEESLMDRGVGPYITENSEDAFFAGIVKILENTENVKIVLKPKRPKINIFHTVASLEILKEKFPERIINLEFSLNPLIAIQCSDIIISTLGTSASFLGDYSGRKSFWFDPQQRGKYVTSYFPKDRICNNIDQLIQEIKRHDPLISNKFDVNDYLSELKKAFNSIL